MEIKIRYFVDALKRIEKIDKGDWIDLRAAMNMKLKANRYYMIPLGVAMELPEGYEAHIVPRSSAFKKWGIIQTNSMGVIDNSYCGNNDQWHMPVYTTRDTEIKLNDRICQFRLVENQPGIEFIEVDKLDNKDRNGFGSTGTN